jgi:hypothetical protein
MLKEILKHTKQYLKNDVIEWIIKKALQGSLKMITGKY